MILFNTGLRNAGAHWSDKDNSRAGSVFVSVTSDDLHDTSESDMSFESVLVFEQYNVKAVSQKVSSSDLIFSFLKETITF